jgi:hypothetical protein
MKHESLVYEVEADCPYCGSAIYAEIDLSVPSENFVEDCEVCCAPILFRVATNDLGDVTGVEAVRENG